MFEYNIYRFDDCPKEAFQFRYQVYVEEMHRPQAYACHDSRTIIDPLDRMAYHGVATKEGKIAAVIRLNFVRDGGIDPYYDFYEVYRLSPQEQATSCICTRNMVAERHRHTPLAYRMLRLMYVLAIENSCDRCFIDVNGPFVPMFEKLGCRPVMEKEHPDYGPVTVMRLDGLDLEYLTSIRSPFAPICKRFLEQRAELTPV